MPSTYRLSRSCACSARISDQNKSGLCAPCVMQRNNANPAVRAKRNASVRRAMADPALRARMTAKVKAAHNTPEMIEKKRAAATRNYHKTVGSEKARKAANSPDAIRRRNETRVNRQLAWCPPEYRNTYRYLNQVTGKPAQEARAIVLRLIEDERRKERESERERLAELSPFERQMEALMRGAALTERRPMPRVGYDMTLGGVTEL